MISFIPRLTFRSSGKPKGSPFKDFVPGRLFKFVGLGRDQSGGKDHFSCFLERHFAVVDFFVVHDDHKSGHGIRRGWDEDGGDVFFGLGIVEVPGHKSDQAATGAGIFDIGDTFKLPWSAEVAHGIDELLDGSVDES